jgi:hypothetical protein
MPWKRAAALAWIALLAVPATAFLPPAAAAPEPQSFTIPYVYRTMEGLQTNLIQPDVTYDHLHDVAWAPDGHMAIAVGSHNTLVGYDAATGNASILRNGTLGNLYGVAWSDDSQVALAVGWDGALIEVRGPTITDLAPEGSTTWQGAAYVPHGGAVAHDVRPHGRRVLPRPWDGARRRARGHRSHRHPCGGRGERVGAHHGRPARRWV